MLFKEVPGNNIIKKQLISSVKNNRISHAQIFSGNSGNAKLALALAYARYINCDNKKKEDSCGQCLSCSKYNTLSHPDLHLIFPVIKTTKEKRAISDNFVEEWRKLILQNCYASLSGWIDTFGIKNKKGQKGAIYKDEAVLIQKKLLLKNFEAKYRIFLIWMPEKMNVETSNKLLKIFEEPPKGTVFLLVSEAPNKLLATVISRFQEVKINDFTTEDKKEFLNKYNLTFDQLELAKSSTDSDFGKIIRLLNEDSEEINLLDDFSAWMRFAYRTDILSIVKWVDSISICGRKQQIAFLSYAIKIIRECLIFNYTKRQLLSTNQAEFLFISRFAAFVHEKNSVNIIEELEETIKSINRNANAKILFFELSLQMIKLLKVKLKFAVK